MADLTGEVAWVTGGASGIGAACVMALAEAGADVTAMDVDTESLEKLSKSARASELEVHTATADAADPEQLERVHTQIARRVNAVSIVINNVAIAEPSILGESDDSHWNKVLSTNFLSFVRTIRLTTPGMIKRGGGVIVNLNSNHSRFGHDSWSAYASAKGAISSLTRQQAVELAPHGIRVLAVTPGPIETALNRRLIQESSDPVATRREFAQRTALGRLGQPEEVAALILFAVSTEAEFITGTDLVIDGGEAAKG